MSFTANMTEFAGALRLLSDVCVVGASLGCILTFVAIVAALLFAGRERRGAAAQPPVTVLKPLHSAEPGLADRLAAFCEQEYEAAIQVLCGTKNTSAAAALVNQIKVELPDRDIELAVDHRCHGANHKVSNLINMMPRARHDTLVLSDSDIVVGRDYLRSVMSLLAAPGVGAVTCLYYGIGGDGVWSRLSALAINMQFLTQAIIAVTFGLVKPCCGSTIAIRRSLLDRIGGFGALADVLADDHAIGLAVRSAGYEVVTAPFLVGHRCFEKSLRELFRQQLRVARTIRSIAPIGYACTFVAHPFPLALIATASGSSAGFWLAIVALMSRIVLCRCVEQRFGLPRQHYHLVPVHDIIAFAVYVASFLGATVHWRGADYRLTANGTLLEDKT
jgi:ceramide glucosyltransferase